MSGVPEATLRVAFSPQPDTLPARLYRALSAQSGPVYQADRYELGGVGVVLWRATATRLGRFVNDSDMTVTFVGLWVMKPAAGRWARIRRRVQANAMFAADRNFGSLGAYQPGQLAAGGVGVVAGAAVDAAVSGGLLPMIVSGAVGFFVGLTGWGALRLGKDRRFRGPVVDSAMLSDFARLATAAAAAEVLKVPGAAQEIRATVTAMIWQSVAPGATDASYAQIWAQSASLERAIGDAVRAQSALDAATTAEPGTTRSTSGSPVAGRLADHVADTTARLRANAAAMRDVAGQLRKVNGGQ